MFDFEVITGVDEGTQSEFAGSYISGLKLVDIFELIKLICKTKDGVTFKVYKAKE